MEAAASAEQGSPSSALGRIADAVGSELRDARSSFAGIARNPSLRRIQMAWAASVTGQWSYGVALAVFAYKAGGAAGVGLAGLLRTAPTAVAGPFVSALGDRYPRVRVMVGSDLVRALLLALGALAITTDAPAIVVYLLGSLVMVASVAFRPAQAALLPSLTSTPEELTASNVASSTIESVGFFLGPALGGVLLAVSSPQVVFAAAAATCVWSAGLLAGLPPERSAGGEKAEDEHTGLVQEVVEGFRVTVREPSIRLLVGLFSLQTLVCGVLNVLVVVMAFRLLHSGQSGVGFLNAAMGVGGVLGTLAALPLVGRGRLAPGFAVGLALWGLPIALIALLTSNAGALLCLAVVGIANTLVDVAGITLMQRAVDNRLLARVMGMFETAAIAGVGLGAVIAAPLVHGLGARGALVATGLLLPVCALLAWPRLRSLEQHAAAPPAALELLRRLPVFAPLSQPTLEGLAGRLARVDLPAGEAVIHQAEPGDRFYVIESGELDATVDGKHASTMGAGEGFGEIALLRDVPRTATVTAVTESVLWALERDDFLAAVTGAAPAEAAAESLASARLAAFSPSFMRA